jgi:hypothetical protein
MPSLATFIDLHNHTHSLGLYCIACNRWGEADLNWLIETGQGHRQLTETKFRCRKCGGLVEKQLRPPVPEIGSAKAYI